MKAKQEKQELQIELQSVFRCLEILRTALTKYSEKVTAGNPMIKCEDMKHDIDFLMGAVLHMLYEQTEGKNDNTGNEEKLRMETEK